MNYHCPCLPASHEHRLPNNCWWKTATWEILVILNIWNFPAMPISLTNIHIKSILLHSFVILNAPYPRKCFSPSCFAFTVQWCFLAPPKKQSTCASPVLILSVFLNLLSPVNLTFYFIWPIILALTKSYKDCSPRAFQNTFKGGGVKQWLKRCFSNYFHTQITIWTPSQELRKPRKKTKWSSERCTLKVWESHDIQ